MFVTLLIKVTTHLSSSIPTAYTPQHPKSIGKLQGTALGHLYAKVLRTISKCFKPVPKNQHEVYAKRDESNKTQQFSIPPKAVFFLFPAFFRWENFFPAIDINASIVKVIFNQATESETSDDNRRESSASSEKMSLYSEAPALSLTRDLEFKSAFFLLHPVFLELITIHSYELAALRGRSSRVV